MIKKLLFKIITFYQYFFSIHFGKVCRFYPSCSEYYILSLEKHGVLKGSFFMVKRILKCHPLHPGGMDIP